jgi:hypothetical protein
MTVEPIELPWGREGTLPLNMPPNWRGGGREPDDDLSTDPDGLISQPYVQREKSGGFLEVTVRPPQGEAPAVTMFAFYDEHGVLLYSTERTARP